MRKYRHHRHMYHHQSKIAVRLLGFERETLTHGTTFNSINQKIANQWLLNTYLRSRSL